MSRGRKLILITCLCAAISSAAVGWLIVRREPVGPLTRAYECSWDAQEGGYRDHIVYYDRNGQRISTSPSAGLCSADAEQAHQRAP